MRRRSLLALVPAGLITACGDGGGGATPAPGRRDQVTVGVIAILDVAPIHLGKQKGFFTSRNIELTLTNAQGGAAIVPAVLSGQFQFGFSNVVSLLLAQSRKLPLKVVCNGNNSTGVDGEDFGSVLVKADSPIRGAADLPGRSVAVNTLQNIVDTTVRASVRKAGGDPSSLRFVEMPFPDMPAALQGGRVDAAFMVEPFQSAARAQGARSVATSYVDAAPDLTVALYFTSTSLISQNADLVNRFGEAMRESLAYANDHPDEARAVIGTYTQIAPEVIADLTLPKWPPDINRASVQTLADLALQDGLLAKPADLTSLLP
ncbi:ABC transporter substrate-binding protein [Micromonospora sp. CPCC 205371]|nr:ABC transporter substrate-binding protein [Micromonospora sp. CPCC 205371]